MFCLASIAHNPKYFDKFLADLLATYTTVYQNKLSLLICFRKNALYWGGHLQLKKIQSTEVKQRISNSFDTMFVLY